MDIHKPKPVHSWRDLFKEIGIIVIGVSIALAGEQAVEKWREHRQHREARQAMFDELSGNLSNIRQRKKYVACTRARLHDISDLLDRAESGAPFAAPSWIGPAITYRLRFVAEGEAQKSTLFSSAEQRSFASSYSYFHSLDVEQDRERQAWGRLRMLQGKKHLSLEMIQSLHDALADASFESDRMEYLMTWLEAVGRQQGLDATSGRFNAITFVGKHPHCLPLDTPIAEAERETAMKLPARLQ